MKNTEGDGNQEILSSFLKQFYSGSTFIPKEILIEEHVEDLEVIEEWLSNKRGNKVFGADNNASAFHIRKVIKLIEHIVLQRLHLLN